MKRPIMLFTGILVSLFILSGCGSAKKGVYDGSTNSKPATEGSRDVAEKSDSLSIKNKDNASTTSPKSPESTTATDLEQRKIIRNGTIDIQSTNFDNSMNEILKRINDYQGYTESSTVSGKRIDNETDNQNRYARISVRIPVKNFDEFIDGLKSTGNVISQNLSSNEITSQYFDTEARLKSLTIQQDRLLELLKKSGELKDMLEIEKELQRVRYEIENLTGTLKKWDNLIEYSTLNINLQEVQKYKKQNPVSLKEKAYYGFISSVDNVIYLGKLLVIFLISIIPYLIVLVPVGLIARYLYKNKDTKFKNLFKKNK